MEELKKLINEHGVFSMIVVNLLYGKFGDVVTLDTALRVAQELDNIYMNSLDEIDEAISSFDDNYADFLREYEVEVKLNADKMFIDLDFAKTVKDNYIIYKYYAVDYTIEVMFNMVEKTYQNNRYYQGSIDLDYEVETVLHDAINQFILENFK